MAQLHVRQLGAVRKALSEAARTDDSSAERVAARFVELRPGIMDKLVARRHHLLTGRRGTGKSTLLQVARRQLKATGISVAAIDMERFKGRKYPDVLIEILATLLGETRPKVRPRHLVKDVLLRRQVSKLQRELAAMLADPDTVVRRVERRIEKQTRSGLGGSIELAKSNVNATASRESASATGSLEVVAAEHERAKIERLQELAVVIARILSSVVERSEGKHALIFIDDYYFVPLADQPAVLGYLHQVCKNSGVWLKVGGVGGRLNPYQEGDPPLGMQPGQEIDQLVLDVTLHDFATAQRFLENVLDGILASFSVTSGELFTATARDRMVLACGGAVARDYITITDAALDEALERMSRTGEPAPDDRVQVRSEDVHRAVRKRLNSKEEGDLGLDSGDDANRLRDRWRDICDFAREKESSAFVLVRKADLDGLEWGKEVQQLENLRLLHRIKDTVPNTPNWRGTKTVVFMIDLAQVADQRLRKGIPEFWKNTATFDELRRAEWVYAPEWRK